MNWTQMLNDEVGNAYGVAEKLIDRVDDKSLGWKPATGKNWMTTGQLLMHMTGSCGAACKGFVTGDWGMPEGVDMSEMSMEDMLPPAEKLPSIGSVAEAKKLLAADKKLALEMIAKAGEKKLATAPAPAPWDPREINLGQRLMNMIHHLTSHKSQLFYYLKLQGQPVNTGHLWGM
ncbi:MAG: DinB family protein [Candidatus Eisenbacteria bacterium]